MSCFLIAWQDDRGSSRAIYGQRLNDSSLIGSNFLISDASNDESLPDVARSEEAGAYLVAWAGIPDLSNSFTTLAPNIYSRLARQTTQLQTTVIDYDPLYSGDLTAGYSYVYDAVGNMTAYTETIGSETSSAGRVFNAANQLLVSVDSEAGSTSFTYDNNGNLVQILPPGVNSGEAGEQLYTFNQRNLLTGYQLGAGSSVYDTVAEYVYDGDGNRVQQIDHSGSQPVTTTYTNDNSGLSQVLVSDDGTTQTHNLLGLNLNQQNDGSYRCTFTSVHQHQTKNDSQSA